MVKLSQFPEFDVMERAQIDQVIDEKAFTSIAQGGSLQAPWVSSKVRTTWSSRR